ncbi:asparagine synthase-related protein [Pajaroellobacter abortibovis]|uniref:asparagine synthase-related protein n=1 Tax=Pajaroellobacter abortibovis TaxID=1882918 RepID=UPI001FE9EC91|nr:asparagine synthase-related protein [Pajaroellobacter abortibovis]
MRSVLVCYSGGVDSALVLAIAHQVLKDKVIGVTAISPSLASFERKAAIETAQKIGTHHELIFTKEINQEDYRKNHPDRCFHCRSELHQLTKKKLGEWGPNYIINGT